MRSRTNSQQLRAKIELASARLDAVIDEVWGSPHLAEIYPEILFVLFSITRSSVPLMEAAREVMLGRYESDPLLPGMVEYLNRHIVEETGHDDLVLRDLERLGVRSSEVLSRMSPAPIAFLAGAQYYWIYHFHPIALLGYIAVLEGNPPDADEFHGIAGRAGIPMEAMSTLFLHADVDHHHRHELDALLDALPLTEKDASTLGISAFHTLDLLAQAFEEVLKRKSTCRAKA